MSMENIAFAAVLATALIAVIGLDFWRKVRLAQAEASVKQEAIRKGLSIAEIQRLLVLSTDKVDPEADVVGSIARHLTGLGVSGVELEQAMAMVQGADFSTKRAVLKSLDYTNAPCFNDKDRQSMKEHRLAVLRGCCGAARENGITKGDTLEHAPANSAMPG